MGALPLVTELPSWFADDERPGRRLRVTPHPSEGVVALSLWDGPVCLATHRVPRESVPDLVGCLAGSLVASPSPALTVVAPAPPPMPSGVARLRRLVVTARRRLRLGRS